MFEIQVKAILARFGGNLTHAMIYCHDMVLMYPRLKSEYDAYHEILMGMRGSHV